MGLDMYLYRKTFKPFEQGKKPLKVEGFGEHVNDDRVKSITEEVGYWRKANHIHKWFVDNVQGGEDDCREYELDREKLEELRDLCVRVKDKPELASMLLPTTEGFFFGGTEYDEYYRENIEETADMLTALLDEKVEDGVWTYFTYQSSW